MEKYFPRNLTSSLIKNLDSRQIFAIVGPRQSGKTTLFKILKKHLLEKKHVLKEKIFYFNFEDFEIRNQFNKNPKEFVKRRIEDLKGRSFFFFDEYHWAKNGGQKLKLLFDLFAPKVKFFITGSSSLELTFKTGKFLVGRLFYFYLYPFSFEELLTTGEKPVFSAYKEMKNLSEKFKIPAKQTIFEDKIKAYFQKFVIFGGYPEVIKTKGREKKKLILKSIVNTYLEKEIRSLLLIEDLEGYRKFLQILASQVGELLSYDQVANDSGLNFKLLKKYFSILEETYVLKRIRPFYKNLTSELRKSPKLYFVDLGLRNFLVDSFVSLEKQSVKGEMVENFVFSQFLKKGILPNFWRTKGKAEVDFVLKREGGLLPVEVKYRNLKKPAISRSFASFISCYQPERAMVLTNGFWGKRRVGKTEVLFMPVWYV